MLSDAEIVQTVIDSKAQLLLMDLDFNEQQGIALCSVIRQEELVRNALLIIFSAQADAYIQVEALNAGADDYLLLPVSDRLFKSKVNSWLWRFDANVVRVGSANHAGSLTLFRDILEVEKNGIRVSLSQVQYKLLSILASKPGKVFSRREVLEKGWGDTSYVKERTVDVHVKEIRQKLGPEVIQTVIGIGYRFCLDN